MKNKIIGVAVLFSMATLVILNISIVISENSEADLNLLKVKTAQADDAEYAGWDNFWQGQGFYKDEKAMVEPCPIYESNSGSGSASYGGGSASGSGSGTQVNPEGRHDVRCTNGSSNCSSVSC
ncbi:MAG: hypothetical protein COC06_09930 [Bacteroidales bacterium]|nr:MAG: hypothetical protein COC06_09930 [Bacteroidales bacterium]